MLQTDGNGGGDRQRSEVTGVLGTRRDLSAVDEPGGACRRRSGRAGRPRRTQRGEPAIGMDDRARRRRVPGRNMRLPCGQHNAIRRRVFRVAKLPRGARVSSGEQWCRDRRSRVCATSGTPIPPFVAVRAGKTPTTMTSVNAIGSRCGVDLADVRGFSLVVRAGGFRLVVPGPPGGQNRPVGRFSAFGPVRAGGRRRVRRVGSHSTNSRHARFRWNESDPHSGIDGHPPPAVLPQGCPDRTVRSGSGPWKNRAEPV